MIDWTAFRPIASMLHNAETNQIAVSIIDDEVSALEGVVYAWRDMAGNVIRVGSAKQPIGKRLRAYSVDINKSLAGLKSATPEWEAAAWLKLVNDGQLNALVHQPPLIETAAGLIRPYLDIERVMISALKPQMNRSHR